MALVARNVKPILRSNYITSPLRYAGGKSRAVKQILPLFPVGIDVVCSPFLGGGSIELALASQGIKVKSYDSFSPLVVFWQMLLSQPKQLAKKVKGFYPLTHKRFYTLQKNFYQVENHLNQAAIFYTLNRASFSGTTLSGGMSPSHPRFTKKGINELADFCIDGFSVECRDFTHSISKNEDAFLYCDPPYMNGQSLYGNRGNTHKSFDHQLLAIYLNKRKRWILSYNNCETIKQLYKKHHIIEPNWAYGMGNKKTSNELLIISKDL